MRHKIEQGSEAWHQLRSQKIGASDAASIMGVCPYGKTAYQLWEEKTGIAKRPESNSAMRRGSALEEEARRLFIEQTGIYVEPAVCTSDAEGYDFMMASYDGLSLCGEIAVEIKCPKREFHDMARHGEVPAGYIPQLQHQIFVNNIKKMFYASYNGENLIIIEVKRDDIYIKTLLEQEKSFYEHLSSFEPPALQPNDYTTRVDDEWVRTASNCIVYAAKMKEFEELYEAERLKLIELAQGENCVGGGLRLSRSIVKGRIDYKKIPELKGVNLEKYRNERAIKYTIKPEKNGISDGFVF
jgi:putative phage-type endonuclease